MRLEVNHSWKMTEKQSDQQNNFYIKGVRETTQSKPL